MNTLKTTMSKIAQIEQSERSELAKHEVELSIVTDMVGYAKKLSQGNKDVLEMNKNIASLKEEYSSLSKLIDSKLAAILRLQKSVVTSYDANKKTYSGTGKFVQGLKQKFEENAKELGMNPSSSAEYKNLLDAMNNNMWASMLNIDNQSYFFRELDAVYNTLIASVSKIKK